MTTEERRAHRATRILAGLRIFIGLLFLATWVENLVKGLYGSEYAPFIQGWADESSIPLVRDFLEKVVIPNADIFRSAQFVTEFLVMGVFLAIGFLTPLSALIAAGFAFSLLVASIGTSEWYGLYALMIAVLVAVAVGQAGRTFGVDRVLARRRPDPRVPLY